MVASGSGTLISQNIGANKEKRQDWWVWAVAVGFFFCGVLSVFMSLSANSILDLYNLMSPPFRMAVSYYLWNFGVCGYRDGVFIYAPMDIPHQPMIVNIVALLINVTGIIPFMAFGLPVTGVCV